MRLAQRTLKYLRLCRSLGIEKFIECLINNKVWIGMFSDYPALEKLHALGLAGKANLTLCATDPGINALKPNPAGYLRPCRAWGLTPEQVLYIGAGPTSMLRAPQIVRNKRKGPPTSNPDDVFFVSGFAELTRVLLNNYKS
jgi:FMN phosphatase YigB (HAD superfamily)